MLASTCSAAADPRQDPAIPGPRARGRAHTAAGRPRPVAGLRELRALTVAAIAMAPAAALPQTVCVSLTPAGIPGNGPSEAASVSADGRWVAFHSRATDLVAPDANGSLEDVYVWERRTGRLVLASVDSQGVQGDDRSVTPVLSADGRHVAFASDSANLVPGDSNGAADVFVRDLLEGTTERISVGPAGVEGNGASWWPSISGDGRYVAFSSLASNLVPGDSNGSTDIILHDRQMGQKVLVTLDAAGNQVQGSAGVTAVVSDDGRRVAFLSSSNQLVPGDTNLAWDVFVKDLKTGGIVRASTDSAGNQSDLGSNWPAISPDGRYVTFVSAATNLVPNDTNGAADAFLKDLHTNQTLRVSVTTSEKQGSAQGFTKTSVSAQGRFVSFESRGALVPGKTLPFNDVFVRDRQLGQTVRVSVDAAGNEVHFGGERSSISRDGRYVVFESLSDQLVPGDTNGELDVFLHDRGCIDAAVAAYCTAKTTSAGCTPAIHWSGAPSVTSGAVFRIAGQVLQGVLGSFLYSIHGPAAVPFQGGTLCVQPPLQRLPQQLSSSGAVFLCGGQLALDFNAHIAAGLDPSLVAGATVWGQFWIRDLGDPFGFGMSDGIRFTLCP